jgi:hypothetical protein
VATKRRNEEKSLSTESGKIKESKVKARKNLHRPKTEKRRVEGKKEWERTKNDEQKLKKRRKWTEKEVEACPGGPVPADSTQPKIKKIDRPGRSGEGPCSRPPPLDLPQKLPNVSSHARLEHPK